MSSPDRIRILDGDVDTAAVAEYEASRREALRRGIGAGGAIVAAVSIPALLGVRNAFAQAQGDEAILEAAIRLEHTAVGAYASALAGGHLDAGTRRTARAFRGHESEHLDALSSALRQMGGRPPAAGQADLLRPLARARTQSDVLAFAVELETMAVAAYYDAHRRLRSASLLQTGSSIMASEGQHLVVLRTALARNPVPNAFETGQA